MRPTSIGIYKLPGVISRFSEYVSQARGFTTLPTNSIILDLNFGVNFTALDYAIESLIMTCSGSTNCVKDLRSIHGADWETGVRKAMYNELYCVMQFIEFSRDSKVSIPNFYNFCVTDITVGSARLLELCNKQPDVFPEHFLPESDRVYTRYNTFVDSSNLKQWCIDRIGNADFLTHINPDGTNRMNSITLYTLGSIRKHFDTFNYATFDLQNYSPLQYSFGDFTITDTTYSYLDTKEDIDPMSIALNAMYYFTPGGDWGTLIGSDPFNKFNQTLNYNLHSYRLCNVWTGLSAPSSIGYSNVDEVRPFRPGPTPPPQASPSPGGPTPAYSVKSSKNKRNYTPSDLISILASRGYDAIKLAAEVANSPVLSEAIAAYNKYNKVQDVRVSIEEPSYGEVSFQTPVGAGRIRLPRLNNSKPKS